MLSRKETIFLTCTSKESQLDIVESEYYKITYQLFRASPKLEEKSTSLL